MPTPPAPGRTPAECITSLLQTLADKNCEKNLTGVAIGVIFDGQEYAACSGYADAESQRPVSESTVFEIGSLSKLFTSLLLANAVTKGEVALDDPVQTALGDTVTLPTDGESQITYRSLANHRSSLPRLPDDLIATADMQNPYAHYDQAMLYACLNRMKRLKPIGSRTRYSNFGVGLLGHALGRIAGSDYRTALQERLLIPLGLYDTSTESDERQAARLATAHQQKDIPTRHWDFTEAMVAAGGLRSSLSDLLRFLRANLFPEMTPLADELKLMREPSELPKCDRNPAHYLPNVLMYLGGLSLLPFFAALTWSTGQNLQEFLLIALPAAVTYTAAYFAGFIPGAVMFVLSIVAARLFWVEIHSWIATIIFATSLFYIGWGLRQALEQLQSKGRLGWQDSQIGHHPLLWHNGMVGGAASYLGIAPELEIGVVVLTNTAKPVDAIGVRILNELMKLKKQDRAKDPHPSEETG